MDLDLWILYRTKVYTKTLYIQNYEWEDIEDRDDGKRVFIQRQ